METQTLNYRSAFENVATETAPGLDEEALAALRNISDSPLFTTPSPPPQFRELWGNIGRWVIAVTAATTPVGYIDVQRELRRSGASAIVWFAQRKRGRSISLRQARELAFSILADAEQRLAQERASEARFLLELWDDETVSE